MKCIDSKFEIAPCGCKFLIRADQDSALLIQLGVNCNDPFHKDNPTEPNSSDDCIQCGIQLFGIDKVENPNHCLRCWNERDLPDKEKAKLKEIRAKNLATWK